MNKKKYERGQSIVLLMVVVIGLLGFMALSVDGGIIFTERGSAQIAADSAAFAAAYAVVEGSDPVVAARNQAAINGIIHNGSDPIVEVIRPPADGQYAGNNEYVQVRITSSANPVFLHFAFKGKLINKVESVARVVPGSSGSLFGGNAIIALNKNASPAVKANGNATVDIENGGIFSNSSASGTNGSNSSVWINEDKTFWADGGITIVTGAGVKNISSVAVHTGATQYNVTAETFAFVPPPPATPTCSSSGSFTVSGNTTTYSPGKYTSEIKNSKTAVFKPGVYCLTKGADFGPNSIVTGQPGKVVFVLGSSDISLDAKSTFDDFEVFSDSAEFKIESGSYLIANRFRFYGYGNGPNGDDADFTVGSNDGYIQCYNAFLYFNKGDIDWLGTSKVDLKAPPAGDPYANLLVYMPLTHPATTYHMNGNSDIFLTGTWLTPTMTLWSNGNSDMNAYHCQFIVDIIQFNGNTSFLVDYDAAENVSNPQATQIELVK